MTFQITSLILFSALIHSIWNIQLKKSSNPLLFIVSIGVAGWLIFAPYTIYKIFTDFPETRTLLFTMASFFIHFFYFIYLGKAYSKYELSVVYPSARGLSVFLLPLYGIFILGESISTVALLGCGLIIIGILMTGSIRISNFLSTSGRSKLLKGGIFSAILIGIIISLYSLVDKKAAPGIDPILFVWITDTSAVILFIYFYFTNKDLKKLIKIEKFKLLIPGIFQYGSYAIVIHAYATTQLAYAGTFREIGTVFGAVFAKIFLKETFTRYKTLGILIIVVGAILISTF